MKEENKRIPGIIKGQKGFIFASIVLIYSLYSFISNADPLNRVEKFFIIMLLVIQISDFIILKLDLYNTYPKMVEKLERYGRIVALLLALVMFIYFVRETGMPFP